MASQYKHHKIAKTMYNNLIKASIYILMAITTGISASAQEIYDHTKNPYGLVYRNAITENRPGEVKYIRYITS